MTSPMHTQRVFGQVFSLETVIAAVVFGLVLVAMLTAAALSWHRRRRGKPAARRAEHHLAEGSYVLALTGMAVFLIVTSFSATAIFFHDPPPALTVRATGFQWCWDFSYPGRHVAATAPCAGRKLPTLVVPAGRPVRFEVTSRDVIHSFWVPALRLKMDAYPQHVNSFTVTLRRGRWLGHCAQFCGLYHDGMMFYLEAVPPGQFAQWLRAHGGNPALAGRS